MLGGDPYRGIALAADPDRQTLALWRLGMDADLRDLHEASLVAEGRPRPREPKDLDRLLETRLTVIGRVTEGAALLEQPSRSDAELEAPVREHVNGRGLLRERDRVGDDERHDRDPEAHPLRRRGDEPERRHRVGPRGPGVP